MALVLGGGPPSSGALVHEPDQIFLPVEAKTSARFHQRLLDLGAQKARAERQRLRPSRERPGAPARELDPAFVGAYGYPYEDNHRDG